MKLAIPGKFSEVTLRTFLAFHKAKTDVQRIAAISGASISDVKKIQADSIREVIGMINEVLDLKTAHHVKIVRTGNVDYGFIPDVTSMSYGEHVDLSAYAKQIWGNTPHDYTTLPDMLAILYRPVTERVGDKYRIKDYDSEKADHRDAMLDLSMDKVQGALLFFSSIRKKLLSASLPYLAEEMKRLIAETDELLMS